MTSQDAREHLAATGAVLATHRLTSSSAVPQDSNRKVSPELLRLIVKHATAL